MECGPRILWVLKGSGVIQAGKLSLILAVQLQLQLLIELLGHILVLALKRRRVEEVMVAHPAG